VDALKGGVAGGSLLRGVLKVDLALIHYHRSIGKIKCLSDALLTFTHVWCRMFHGSRFIICFVCF